MSDIDISYVVSEYKIHTSISRFNLKRIETCPCCKNEKSEFIAEFREKMHAQRCADYLTKLLNEKKS